MSSLLEQGENFLQELFKNCGEDPQRDGLKKTPLRVVKAFEELTRGYREDPREILNDALFDCDVKEPIVVRNIPFYSLCEHHLLPFYGVCHIQYLPKNKVIGLSKIYRLVDLFSHRLQLQERLTHQIAESLYELSEAQGVQVYMEAEHLCVAMRGTRKIHSKTCTRCSLGVDLPPMNAAYVEAATQHQLSFQTKELSMSLGCYPEEHIKKTPVVVKVKIDFQNLPKACDSDQLADTVCYDHLTQYIEKTCREKHFELVEHACKTLFDGLKALIKVSANIEVKITKILDHPFLEESSFSIKDF